MQSTPFRSIVPFSEELLGLPFKSPGLQSLPGLRIKGFMEIPCYTIPSISADPLPVEIDVYVNIKASLDVNSHIRSRYRLTQGGCRCNW